MSWIVVLESEGRQTESIREGLTEDGWLVETATSFEAAVAAVTERMPQLVLAGAQVPRAAELLEANSRRSSGPGSLVLVAPGDSKSPAVAAADERLERPFSDNDLRLLVRRMVTAGRAGKAPAPAEDAERLTSQDLFGDMLAEVESESAALAPPFTAPVAPAAPSSGIDRTLSNLLQSDRPKPAPAKKADTGVDDLLSRTLSGLDVGSGKRPAAKPKPPAPAKPAAAPPPASPPQVETPAAAAAPKPGAKSARPGRQQSVDRLLADVTPPPVAPTRRSSKQIDLSALDDLARSPARSKSAPADPLGTQKIAIPAATPAPVAAAGAGGPAEFGQYALLERIALGGMAEVWKARMKGVEGFQKTVAIKKILPHLTDSSDFVTMFIDEAKLAAQLNHTNIIHIYDLGKINEDYYIAMEFVDGKDLRSIINSARDSNQPIPLDLALLIASRLASALDHAHRKKDFEGKPLGLVHRDVSPQNVLISYDGDIKLCDFGIVKAVSKASKTQMGALKGKLQYMSPEQAWGRPVDARSDIFSLGSLLFEMLTGRRLFTGESEMSVLDAVREGRVQAPRDLDPRVPLEVNNLVLKALAREPKGRFKTAGDLQREIDGILASLKPAPSQHSLAQYMHKLYAAESRTLPAPEKAEERPAKIAPAAAKSDNAPTTGKKAAQTEAPPAPSAQPGQPGQPDTALEAPAGSGRKMLWIGIAAVILIGVVGIMMRGGSPAPTASTPPPPTTGPAAAEPAPTDSEPAATAATAAPAATADNAEATEPQAAPETTTQPDLAPAAAAVKAEAAKPEPAKPEAAQPEPAKPAAAKLEPARPEADPKPTPAAATPAQAPAARTEAPVTTEAEPTAPAAPAVTPQPEPTRLAPAAARPQATTPRPTPAPPKPSVREGDLVELGAGVTAPVLVSVNKPEYPPMARRTKVEGTVVLSLLVDETGRVIDVRVVQGVSLNVGINESAVTAARTARFRPATKDGVRVKVWHQLTIPFQL